MPINWSQKKTADQIRDIQAAEAENARRESVEGLSRLQRLRKGFDSDFGAGGEDMRRVGYEIRSREGKQAEAPKMGNMIVSWLAGQRLKEIAGLSTSEGRLARSDHDMGLHSDPWVRTGQVVGTAAGDITQDATRRFYWLLNALQATGEVINEGVQAVSNPALYGKTPERYGEAFLNVKDKRGGKEEAIRRGAVRKIIDPITKEPTGGVKARRGYSITDKGDVLKRNYEPGMVQALSWPSGIAINAGLGLMTPFGGAEGYKAAIPSEEDPTKSANVLGEVALKYIMGRTGNLLPYDEFKKVRPDVSKAEYNAYKAFKYDKDEDYDLTDDDLTIASGAFKYTGEGIHGPEIQFLGRSLPATTGMLPYASAVVGGAAGVKHRRPIKGGLIGGTAGLVAGQVLGNLVEQERRRRNAVENELYAPPTLVE